MGLCKRCGTVITGNVEGEYCAFCEVEIKTRIKDCEWCGKPFTPNHGNEKYCSDDHKLEAKREKTRKRYQKYYKKNKIKEIMRTLGTSTLSKHRNNDFKKEKKVIKNELKKISVSTVYKGKYSYPKGKTKFTNNDQPIGQYGIQLTHNYGTLDDYHKTSLNLIITQNTRKCPDCQQQEVNKDRQHAEIQCSNCGLVLMGPYNTRIKYPFMEYPKPPDEYEKIDPMSWYPKPEKHITKNSLNNISLNTTPIKVICSRCKHTDTIPFNLKNHGCPVCGGHYMGAGICMPHDFTDEFAPPKTENSINYDMRTTEDRGIGE